MPSHACRSHIHLLSIHSEPECNTRGYVHSSQNLGSAAVWLPGTHCWPWVLWTPGATLYVQVPSAKMPGSAVELSALNSACQIILINKQSVTNSTGNIITLVTESQRNSSRPVVQHSSWGRRGEKSTIDICKEHRANCFKWIAFEAEFEICSGARHAGTWNLILTEMLTRG